MAVAVSDMDGMGICTAVPRYMPLWSVAAADSCDTSSNCPTDPGLADAIGAGPAVTDRYMPFPNPTRGNLTVDPEILLKANKFNLAIGFLYDSASTKDAEYGRCRAASPNAYVVSVPSASSVDIFHPNMQKTRRTLVGTSGGVTTYSSEAGSGAISSLSFDGTKFTEEYADGTKFVYQSQVAGTPNTHQLIKAQDAAGNVQTYAYGAAPEAGLVKTITVPGGNVATFTYTPSGGSVSLLNAIQDWNGRRWTFQYDTIRNLSTLTTPLGCSTKYGYTSVGGGIATLLNAITDPRGYVTSYIYNASRQVVSMVAGDGTWEWDNDVGGSGWTVLTSPSGAKTTYNSDDVTFLVNSVDLPQGYRITYTYNSNRVRTQEQTPAGTVYSVTYDTTLWLVTKSDDALGHRTTYAYDSFGNLTTLTDANGKTSTFAYDGTGSTRLRIRATDPLGRVTSFSYDGDGQLKTQTDPRGLVTTYNYDTYGNVASVVASDGGITTMLYDSLNRLTTLTDPLARVTTYAYL